MPCNTTPLGHGRLFGMKIGTLGQVAWFADYGREAVPVWLRISFHVLPIALLVILDGEDFELGLWKQLVRMTKVAGAATQAAHRFLKSGDWSSCGAPVGQAGNGTAMRTAVVGLFFVNRPEALLGLAADVSRITHHDSRSIAGGVAIAKAAQLLASGSSGAPADSCGWIASCMATYDPKFADMVQELPRLLNQSPETAVTVIASAGKERPEFEKPIITPFVVPTVLAALWCVLRYPDSGTAAVASAIRLGGDADTLGAIVGVLMGAKLGASGIPAHLADTIVDAERIQNLAVRYHALVAGRRSDL